MTGAAAAERPLRVDAQTIDELRWLPDVPPAPPPAARPVAAPRNSAPCPIQGYGTTLREDAARPAGGCAARDLPIKPSRAYQPYTCPCPRRALLAVGRTATKGWTLREHRPTRDEREEINLIAHALVTGHGRRDHARCRRVNTAAHPTSAEMDQAFRVSHSLAMQVVAQVLVGHRQRAHKLAEQATADYVHSLHRRAYRREHREGRWQNANEFWINVHTPDREHPGQPSFSLRLVLRDLVRDRFPRAVQALEALRRPLAQLPQ